MQILIVLAHPDCNTMYLSKSSREYSEVFYQHTFCIGHPAEIPV